MTSISLEAFDENIRGKLTQWLLPSDICALPEGFQDQVLSGIPAFQTTILLNTKKCSKAWLLAYNWDMTFIPESNTDWSLLLSILGHMKKPILIVSTPKCAVPPAFWNKCSQLQPPSTCVALCNIPDDTSKQVQIQWSPNAVFFPKLDTISEAQFIKIPSALSPQVNHSIKSLDLRSLYRELRAAGASLCLSLNDSRSTTNGINSQIPEYSSMWFYPEINGALRLHLSDLRAILRTITERLGDSL
jgi:hypothetical protein